MQGQDARPLAGLEGWRAAPAAGLARVERRLAGAWVGVLAVLLPLAAFSMALRLSPEIAILFLTRQDLPALAATTAFLLLLRRMPLPALRLGPLTDRPAARGLLVAMLATGVGAAGAAGVHVVHLGYPLSMDEFMAAFDTAILARGLLAAPVEEEWRAFLRALQPFYVTAHADGAFWASSYLPGNAALRALFGAVGAADAASAFWSALSVVLVYAVARKLWPERPAAALAAIVLFASSRQLLVMAATPYAMAAHLALNLLWLWLFLGATAPRHAAAAATSFVACGLHQVVFHPLFAAPFILQLWLDRKVRPALFHSMAFALIGLFWMLYPSLVAAWAGAAPDAAGGGAAGFLATASRLLTAFDPLVALIMANDLLRFLAWQSPLGVALALCAGAAAWRAGGTLRALLGGIALTLFALFVLMPYQTHGWGYRYLHGLLGNVALLAAFGAMRLAVPLNAAERGLAAARFTAAALFSLLVMLPAQAYQARRLVQPYAEAHAAILATEAELVLVDPTGLFYGIDLVRNDPFLRQRPKIMNLLAFTPDDLARLCSYGDVALFSAEDGLRRGIRPSAAGAELQARAAALRGAYQALSCRRPLGGMEER